MKNNRDPERTRHNILDAATAEFARYGLGGARVDRIAERAGANKRMLYYYYGSKEELFLAVLEASYEHIRSAERELDLEHRDPRQALKRLVEFTWRYYLDHPEFVTLLNSENLHKGRHVRRSRRVRQMHSVLVNTLRAILQRGEEKILLRAEVVIEHALVGAGALRDAVDTRAAEAVVRELGGGGGKDARARTQRIAAVLHSIPSRR